MQKSNFNMMAAIKVAKRIALTVLICIPFLLAFAYLTRKVITTSGLQILCFTIILAVVVGVEEWIARTLEKRKKEKPQIENNKTDMFK